MVERVLGTRVRGREMKINYRFDNLKGRNLLTTLGIDGR
jgi:hypothetical protein